MLAATIDGREVSVPEGTTILDACRRLDIDTPTLYPQTLTLRTYAAFAASRPGLLVQGLLTQGRG
jgi:hypothetical protein